MKQQDSRDLKKGQWSSGVAVTKQQALYLVGLASDRPSSLAQFI